MFVCVSRLTALQALLQSILQAEDIIKVHEARLTEKETTSLDLNEVENYRTTLKVNFMHLFLPIVLVPQHKLNGESRFRNWCYLSRENQKKDNRLPFCQICRKTSTPIYTGHVAVQDHSHQCFSRKYLLANSWA